MQSLEFRPYINVKEEDPSPPPTPPRTAMSVLVAALQCRITGSRPCCLAGGSGHTPHSAAGSGCAPGCPCPPTPMS